jgi:hypothetical protein
MTKTLKILMAGMLLGVPMLAKAQPTGGPASQVDVSVPKKSDLSPQEMLSQSRDYRNRVNGILLRIQSLQEQARKQKDIIRLNCLADKLVQAKVNLNIADQAIVAVQEAVNRKDEAGSLHEFTRVTIVHQKAQVLGAEAEACVGEDLSFVGATKVEVEESPDLPKGDFTNPPIADRPPVERPPQASPNT